MRLRFFLPWFIAVVMFSPCLTHAQSPKSTPAKSANTQHGAVISGIVYDPDGRIIPGVRVTLLQSKAVAAETQTNAQGDYRFEGLPGGTYAVAANLPGLNGVSAETTLSEGQTRTTDLHLKLSAAQDQVVVSASLGGALSSQIGSSVTVVSQEEIENRDAQSVYEVLRGIPGVEVNQTGQRGAVTSAFIRGGNSNYNLVLIDGIPMDDFGGGFDLAPLPVDGVERVEVTRGPQSALYGSNAIAGVVNIVSERGEGTPHFSVLGEGGSFGTWRIDTGGSGLNHGLSWAYNLSRLGTQGVVPNDDYENQTSFLSLGYSRNPRRQFILHFFGDARNVGSPGPFGLDPDQLFPGIDATSRLKQNLFGYQASYTEQFSSRFRQVTTVSAANDRLVYASGYGDSFSNSLRIVANTRSEITLSAKDLFVAGIEYSHEQFRDTYITGSNDALFTLPRGTFAFFAENRWNLGERWFINAGLRVDNIRTDSLPLVPASSVTQVDPRLSVAYLARQSNADTIGVTRIHGSFGTGIRAPDGFELAFTNNPHLKPERNVSFDGGIEQRFLGNKVAIDVTYFYNRFKDQIVTLGGSLQNLSTYTSDNLANSRAYGLENSLRIFPARSLELSAEYTWLNSAILAVSRTDQAQPPFQVGQPLLRRPHNSAGYNITWHHDRLMINMNGTVRGAVLDLEPNYGAYACMLNLQCLFRNKGYVAANTGFAYELPRGVEIYGRLNNFLNQSYEESFGYPALHLNFLAGIKFRFSAEHPNANP